MLVALRPHFRKPIWRCKPKKGVPLVQPSGGTLILLEAARLDVKQQEQLLGWFDQFDGSLQIVTTTSQPLFSLVQSGAFLEQLYYGLNVVRMDLD